MPKRDENYMAAKRDAILDATVRCLERKGLAGLSTTAICEEAGISMGALYTHFATKDEILAALAKRSGERRRATLSITSPADLRQRLRAMVNELGRPATMRATRIDLDLLSASAADARIAEAFKPFHDNRDMADALQFLSAEGKLKPGIDPDVAAAAIEGLLAGFSLLNLMGGKHDAVRSAAMDLLLESVIE